MDIACNLKQPVREVFHSELEKIGDNSPFKVNCPTCNQGILLVRRGESFKLSRLDNCTFCAQLFYYKDETIAGEEFELPGE